MGGAGDQAASAVGNGIVAPGKVSCTLGTSGVVFAHMDEVAYDPAGRVHTFCHAVRGKWHVMGVTQGAGLSLQWFRNRLAPGMDYDALMAEADCRAAGIGGFVLAALSYGRKNTSSGRACPRRMDWPDRTALAGGTGSCVDRRCLVQPERLSRDRGIARR